MKPSDELAINKYIAKITEYTTYGTVYYQIPRDVEEVKEENAEFLKRMTDQTPYK